MAPSEPFDVFVCGPRLRGDHQAHLRLGDGAVIFEPFEGELAPEAESIREAYRIPVSICGGLTLLVTDEAIYLTAGWLDLPALSADVKKVQAC